MSEQIREILDKYRAKDDTLPHWITMKHATLAMEELKSVYQGQIQGLQDELRILTKHHTQDHLKSPQEGKEGVEHVRKSCDNCESQGNWFELGFCNGCPSGKWEGWLSKETQEDTPIPPTEPEGEGIE